MVVLCLGLLGLHWYLLMVRTSPPVAVPRRPGSFLVGEIAAGTRVSQSMVLDAGGFERIAVWAEANGAPSGHLVFELFDITDPVRERYLFGVREPSRVVVADMPHVFRFPVLADSFGRRYRLDVSSPGTPAGQGVSFWMHRGEPYGLGELHVNGRLLPADLVFEAGARDTTAWARLRRRYGGAPGALALLGLLGLANLGALLVAGRLLMAEPGPD